MLKFNLAIICLFSAAFGCGRSNQFSTSAPLESNSNSNPTFNSTYLIESGERAKAFLYEEIAKQGLEVMDAVDPRLYPNGGPYQPRTPADKVFVRRLANGSYHIAALLLDRPGVAYLKEFPTGNFIVSIGFGVEFVAYESRFDGQFGSVSRNTSGYGWNYVYYLRGLGNRVSGADFDVAIARFLSNAAAYIGRL